MGLKNKKSNPIKIIDDKFGVCFYNNINHYFIFSLSDLEAVESHTWCGRPQYKSDKKTIGRIVPVTVIEDKMVTLTKFLMGTPEGYECDHINGNPDDNRRENLRLCTCAENMRNRKDRAKIQGYIVPFDNGEYTIIFPEELEDVSNFTFETYEAAEKKLFELQDRYYGEYSYRRSQEIANMIETYYLSNEKIFHNEILDEIYTLPVRNIFHIRLNEIGMWHKQDKYGEEIISNMLYELMLDFKKSKL